MSKIVSKIGNQEFEGEVIYPTAYSLLYPKGYGLWIEPKGGCDYDKFDALVMKNIGDVRGMVSRWGVIMMEGKGALCDTNLGSERHLWLHINRVAPVGFHTDNCGVNVADCRTEVVYEERDQDGVRFFYSPAVGGGRGGSTLFLPGDLVAGKMADPKVSLVCDLDESARIRDELSHTLVQAYYPAGNNKVVLFDDAREKGVARTVHAALDDTTHLTEFFSATISGSFSAKLFLRTFIGGSDCYTLGTDGLYHRDVS